MLALSTCHRLPHLHLPTITYSISSAHTQRCLRAAPPQVCLPGRRRATAHCTSLALPGRATCHCCRVDVLAVFRILLARRLPRYKHGPRTFWATGSCHNSSCMCHYPSRCRLLPVVWFLLFAIRGQPLSQHSKRYRATPAKAEPNTYLLPLLYRCNRTRTGAGAPTGDVTSAAAPFWRLNGAPRSVS